MRVAPLLAMVLMAAPAHALDVRIKSKHEKVTPEGGAVECYKVGGEESLRGAAIGPGPLRVSLRRLAPPGAPAVTVKLTRDGREVARVVLSAKGVQKVPGESALASAPVERSIDLPKGPHTLFVEVGPGEGQVLVSFDEPEAGPAVAHAGRKAPGPDAAAAASKPDKPAVAAPKPDQVAAAASTAQKPDRSAAAVPKGAEPRPGAAAGPKPASEPKVAALDKGKAEGRSALAEKRPPAAATSAGPKAPEPPATPAEKAPPAPREPPPSAGSAAKLASATPEKGPPEPAAPASSPEPALARRPAGAETSVAATAAAPRASSAHRLLVGARAGAATQAQLWATGPAAGLSARYLAWGEAGPGGARGLFAGLSADYLRYRLGLDLGSSRAFSAGTQDLTLTSFPVVAEALWSFGDPARRRLTPFAGLTAGASFCRISGEGSLGSMRDSQTRIAFGALAGVELPLGADRLGVEVRYLRSRTAATGALQDFEVGGLLAQASWRFGL